MLHRINQIVVLGSSEDASLNGHRVLKELSVLYVANPKELADEKLLREHMEQMIRNTAARETAFQATHVIDYKAEQSDYPRIAGQLLKGWTCFKLTGKACCASADSQTA